MADIALLWEHCSVTQHRSGPFHAHLRHSRKRWAIGLFTALRIHNKHLPAIALVKVGGLPGNESNSQMTDKKDRIGWLLQDQNGAPVDQDSLHYREFHKLSEDFLSGYRRFMDLGFPSEAIGLAMLNATINMYTILEIHKDLPDLFRKLADKIDCDTKLH